MVLHLFLSFLEYLNNIDDTGKIKFTMQVADDNGLESLDLILKIENGRISVDIYSKPTNNFTYVLPSTCYPRNNINNVPRGIALRIRRICDNDEKFAARSTEYGNYLIDTDYNPTIVKKQFTEVSYIARVDARKKKKRTRYVKSNSLLLIILAFLMLINSSENVYLCYMAMTVLKPCFLLIIFLLCTKGIAI